MGRSCRAICIALVCCAPSWAQAPKLEFEVASVRASGPRPERTSYDGETSGGPGTSDPTRIRFAGVPLIEILMTAFDVDQERIVAPEWTANFRESDGRGGTKSHPTAARFDIVATMPPGTTKSQSNEMLKNLLMDRFKLTYHLQKKEFDVYKVTIAAGGSKLKPAEAATANSAAPVTLGLTTVEIPKDAADSRTCLPGNQRWSASSPMGVRRFAWPPGCSRSLLC